MGDFAADGIAARIGLRKSGIAAEAFEALDRGETAEALDALLEQLAQADGHAREQLRRAIVGVLTALNPSAIRYRRRPQLTADFVVWCPDGHQEANSALGLCVKIELALTLI